MGNRTFKPPVLGVGNDVRPQTAWCAPALFSARAAAGIVANRRR
jgi:hypothetical protein